MQRVINEVVCDRCGKVFDPEPSWAYRGAALVGESWDLLARLDSVFQSRGGDVSVRLYYVSRCTLAPPHGSEDKIVDLCDDCQKGLADWFNEHRLERDE